MKYLGFRVWGSGFSIIVLALLFSVFVLSSSYVWAQETTSQASVSPKNTEVTSQDLVRQAWEASGAGNLQQVAQVAERCKRLYGEEADRQQAALTAFPEKNKEKKYQALNDVATCLFVKAEALMNNGKKDEAINLFQKIIKEYPGAKAWDPRGWYWSVAEKSQASIDMLTGKIEEKKPIKVDRGQKTTVQLAFKGTENIVDYSKYGKFLNVGTKDYKYEVTDPVGLQKAIGEGIYPNTGSVLKDPNYQKAREEGRLEGDHWNFVHTDDLEAAFFKWATAPEPWGVKLFYLGLVFERAHMYYEAIKAYHTIVVQFPSSTAWTYWNTPWYPGQAAIAKIRHIINTHPELNLKFNWGKIIVKNGFDNNVANDIVITYPGVIAKKTFWDEFKDKIGWTKRRAFLFGVKRKIGEGKVRLVQYKNNHWRLLVDGKPFIIKGLTYSPTKVGQSPDKGTLANWMDEDTNKNGKPDGPYDSWVDKNWNNEQDADEPVVGDFELMKELGVNTIRVYHQPHEPNKEVLRKMYKDYGIHVIMGDFIGKYAFGSGASWFEGTDYENPEHRKNMLNSVKKMVMEFKDEPYILMWLLGNENNYGIACNADKKPKAYYEFVNEVARWIKTVDKNHPVAICNGDTLYLDIFAKNAPDVDIFAANAYRGDYGFGSFWEQVEDATGKPGFITEYGCPAYANYLSREGAEKVQANYLLGNWLDIMNNAAGTRNGVGNALGGIVFEWMDEWWKNYEPAYHDKTAGAQGPFPDGYMYEEWFGLVGQGDGKHSPFLRQLRKSYYLYKKLWN